MPPRDPVTTLVSASNLALQRALTTTRELDEQFVQAQQQCSADCEAFLSDLRAESTGEVPAAAGPSDGAQATPSPSDSGPSTVAAAGDPLVGYAQELQSM